MLLLPFCSCDSTKSILGGINKGNLTDDEVVQGLKEALKVGTDSSAYCLSLLNGFYKDAA